jgi:DNA-binding HxlR family transcriptional regulator
MRKYSQNCPIARTLDIIGDRWTILILRDLFMGQTKFRDLRASGGIPPKVLSSRLKMLISEEIVERHVYSEHPLRAEYTLTDKGKSLLPILLSLGEWGLSNLYDGETKVRNTVAEIIYEHIPEARDTLTEAGYVKRRTRAG